MLQGYCEGLLTTHRKISIETIDPKLMESTIGTISHHKHSWVDLESPSRGDDKSQAISQDKLAISYRIGNSANLGMQKKNDNINQSSSYSA